MKKEKISGQDNLTGKKTDSLIFKFGAIFAVFTLAALVLCGVATYFFQSLSYKNLIQDQTRNAADYLSVLISEEALNIESHQKYLIEHRDEINVPIDYDGNYEPARQRFQSLFEETYPNMAYGVDIKFDEMTDELKNARAVYVQEKCLTIFENARDSFSAVYTYYIVPGSEPYYMYYVIDAVREGRENDEQNIDLGYYVFEDPARLPVMWKVWEAGEPINEFEKFDNEFGQTYGYYRPLIKDGKKLGLIAIDFDIATVNRRILSNAIRLSLGIGVILIIGVIILLIFIERKYIKKLENLVSSVKQYTVSKNPEIAEVIEYDVNTRDEISSLANQTAAMILELDHYMKNLVNTTRELTETRQYAKDLHDLANRDSLTGIRNKTAYDNEIERLGVELSSGFVRFGIAMIDLNFLKKTNDRYGHDKGNLSIKKLCDLVCDIYVHSPVFRIGGDEFAVILKNTDYDNAVELEKTFNAEIDRIYNDTNLEPWERISAAIGVALFDRSKDHTVDDVFRRADEAMYKRKQEMKATRE